MKILVSLSCFLVFIILFILILLPLINIKPLINSENIETINNCKAGTDNNKASLDFNKNIASNCVTFIDPGYFYPEEAGKKEKIAPGTQKGVYLTGYSMGISKKRLEIYELIEKTELNTIVFNAKDDSGNLNYNSNISEALESGTVNFLYDIDEIIKEMDIRNIYSIARIVVFKDERYMKAHPELSIKDTRNGEPLYLEGSLWPDIYCEQYWDYIIKIAQELSEKGVDEIQFDYIRAPARGNIGYADYTFNSENLTKTQAIKKFLIKTRKALEKYDVKISADVFGFVLIEKNDQGIGQLIEEIAPHVDYLYPMIYPSHYSKGFLGYSMPEEHPYEVVKYTLEKGLDRLKDNEASLIPWMQAFGIKMKYTKNEILEQIKAAEELGIKGFLFWNASNKYIYVEEALSERFQPENISY